MMFEETPEDNDWSRSIREDIISDLNLIGKNIMSQLNVIGSHIQKMVNPLLPLLLDKEVK